jgi:hypothetical protein
MTITDNKGYWKVKDHDFIGYTANGITFRIYKSAIFQPAGGHSAICGLLIADCQLLLMQYFMPCKV